MGKYSEYFPRSPKKGKKVSILVHSSEIPQIGEDKVITFRATGLNNRKWEIEDNEPANEKTISKAANVKGTSRGLREHKHRRS